MTLSANPFSLEDHDAYQSWRQAKLAAYPRQVEELLVPIADPTRLSDREREAILDACRRANMALYRVAEPDKMDKNAVRRLGEQLGLHRLDHNLCADEDGIAALRVASGGRNREYIPYSDRPINWHTDGYYNPLNQQVRAIILHCARQAGEGGANALLDHEIAYILLRDDDPGHIRALSELEAMSIPPNVEEGVEIRPRQSGPVFSVEAADGRLHMRYTARARNIEWRDDAATRRAVACLGDLLNSATDYIFTYRMKAGEGLICNNILHNRSGFTNGGEPGQQRLLYRARYYDRMAHT